MLAALTETRAVFDRANQAAQEAFKRAASSSKSLIGLGETCREALDPDHQGPRERAIPTSGHDAKLRHLAVLERSASSEFRSIALSRWPAPLKAESCCSQTLYLFISRLNFLVELTDLRGFWSIVAAQLIEHFANGEFGYFRHRYLHCAWESLLATTSSADASAPLAWRKLECRRRHGLDPNQSRRREKTR
jgi:hypothetical protein